MFRKLKKVEKMKLTVCCERPRLSQKFFSATFN